MNISDQDRKLIKVLAIGGSDPGGGAGIQADIKTLTRQGVYALSALTAVTAQNTMGVQSVSPLPPKVVSEQISVLVSDIEIKAVKIGMLAEAGIVEIVAEELRGHSLPHIVLDPIIRAHTGKLLLSWGGLIALKDTLLPLAEIITPNAIEAEALTGLKISNIKEMKTAAVALRELGAKNVFLKGGHLGEGATDILLSGNDIIVMRGDPVIGAKVHGTGCMLSSVIAAELAKGRTVESAVTAAKEAVNRGIAHSVRLGKGLNIIV